MKNLLILSFVIILVSCGKEEIVTNNNSMLRSGAISSALQYYNDMKKPIDGSFILHHDGGYSNQNNPRPQISGGVMEDGLYLNMNNIKIGNTVISPNGLNEYIEPLNTQLASYYGDNVVYEIGNTLNSVYIPNTIKLTSPVINSGPVPTIGAGQSISWNTDPENPKDVIILVTYDTKYPTNLGYTQPSTKNVGFSSDDGSYTFAASDFQGIPDGASITITINRLNYKFVNVDGKTVLIGGYTSIFAPFEYDAI